MIQYNLKCDEGHVTQSWFKSAAAYDTLEASGHLTCSVCGSAKISKALMAPSVQNHKDDQAPQPMLHSPEADVERAIAELRTKVEETSDYVGESFVQEARAMHLGDVPERSIYGEARLDQAKELIDDGVPLMPLPFRPKQKLT